jgi:hypothetical protein
MASKTCPACHKENAAVNRNCIKCGHLMLRVALQEHAPTRTIGTGILLSAWLGHLFSSVLWTCTILCVLYILANHGLEQTLLMGLFQPR